MQNNSPGYHSRYYSFLLNCKSLFHIVKRAVLNIITLPGAAKQPCDLKNAVEIAYSESDLWNTADVPENRMLTYGKVQNLRIAAAKLNGVEIEAGQVFSFWQHVGRPVRLRGFVKGREIKEGCLVPSTGGGICQLSNALYDAALQAGFEIIERHRHTKIVPGSLAEKDRDATVKWNYLDLRFGATQAFRIEAGLTSGKLWVRLKGTRPANGENVKDSYLQPSKINDCLTCGNLECAHHVKKGRLHKTETATWLLAEKWPETEKWFAEHVNDGDTVITYIPGMKNKKFEKYQWHTDKDVKKRTAPLTFIYAMLQRKIAVARKQNVFASGLAFDEAMAASLSKRIPWQSRHLIISQNLLPYLQKGGVLGGRTYEVLMTRLPVHALHRQLDKAKKIHPYSGTLTDFRAGERVVAAEKDALQNASKIITPHRYIADLYKYRSECLPWQTGPKCRWQSAGNAILFPHPAYARKGAFEMRKLAKELDLEVLLINNKEEYSGFWNGIRTRMASGTVFQETGLIICPSFVEHEPRFLLRAIEAGIKVIATDACGLNPAPGLTILPAGDYKKLKQAVMQFFSTYNIVKYA